MKTAAVVLAAIAVRAVAGATLEIKDYFPECSVECIEKSLPAAKGCETTDSWCLCRHKNYENIYLDAYDCVVDACGFDKAEDEVLPAAEPYCEAATSLYKATATGPIPTETETEEDEDENEHDHDHSSAASPTPSSVPVSSAVTTAAAKETSGAALQGSSAASQAEVTPSTASTTPVPTNGAVQIGSMGAAAVIAIIAAL